MFMFIWYRPERVSEPEHSVEVEDERRRNIVGGGVTGGNVEAERTLHVAEVGIRHCKNTDSLSLPDQKLTY